MTTPITGQGLNVCIPPDDELSLTSKKAAQNKVITEELTDLSNAIDAKQDAPSTAGTAGQVLGLDSNFEPVWINQSGETWHTVELSAADWDSTNHMFLFDAGNGKKIKQAQILGQVVNDGLQTEAAKLMIGFGNSTAYENYSVPASYSNILTTNRRVSFSAKIEMTEFQANNQTIRCANAHYFKAGAINNANHAINVDTSMTLGDTRATNFYWTGNDPRYLKIVIPQWSVEWAYIRISYTLM